MAGSSTDRLDALRDQSRRGLQFLLSSLLTNAEPALVGLATKSRSNVEQSQYYDAIRELRLKGRTLVERFMAKVTSAFDALRTAVPEPAPRTGTPKAPSEGGLRLKGLDVVQDELLEQQLAVEDIASRARHVHRETLLVIGRHVARELGNRRIDIDLLPTGPQALSRAFMASCEEAQIESRARLILSRLFTRFVIDELGPFYEQCLRVFPEDDAGQSGPAAPVAPGTAQVEQDLPTGNVGNHEDSVAEEASADPLLARTGRGVTRTPLLSQPGKAMAMPRTLVDQVLRQLQDQLLEPGRATVGMNLRAGVQPLEIFELIKENLEASGETRAMGLSGDVLETIGLVRMLFDHALRDDQVALAVRRLMRLLQVPLLRAALRDPDVLTNADHPARAFFREIGQAALGWTAPAEPSSDDFYRLVQLLVTRILGDYEKDDAVFTVALTDLQRYVQARDGGARPGSGTAPAAEPGGAHAQAARVAVAELVAGATGTANLPRPVVEFLRGQWSDALFVVRLREGGESSAWGLAVETTARLVAATRPGGDPAGFATVARGMATYLQRLGLDEDAARHRVEALQAVVSVADAGPAAATASPVRAAERPPASPDFLQLVDKMAPDTWVELRPPGGERRRLKLLTRIPRTGQCQFVDRDGAKAGEWHRNELASMIEQGEAVIVQGATAGPPGRPFRR